MTATDWLEQLGFLIVALFTLGSALGVILARRVLYAALWLLPTLFGVAGAFAIMGAHVLFAMQIVVYVGAIIVLILFAAMLLEDNSPRERLPDVLRSRMAPRLENATNLVLYYYAGMQHVLGGVIAAGMMLVVLITAIVEAAWFQQWRPLQPESATAITGTNVQQIGEAFLTTHLLPFEIASVVLLVALIGAVVISRLEPTPCEEPEEDTGGEEAE